MTDATTSELVDEGAEEDVLIGRLLLLHGFTATGRSWDPVRRRIAAGAYEEVLAPDLRGHGEASGTRPATIEACVEDLRQDRPYTLCGYSMGGRIALHLALADPEPRDERRRADEELAEGLERAGLESFVRWWGAQPLFAGQSPEVAAASRADRLRNTAEGLAASLRGMGAGVMEPVWDRLEELTMPAVVLAGERDAKFRMLGEKLAGALPDAELRVVPKAGHAVHLEAPEAVAAALHET